MKKKVFEYLKNNPAMTLATMGETPWVCTVFQMVDEDFNMYFMSSGESRHIQEAMENPNVACSIADSSQRLSSNIKIGMQIEGIVEKVSKLESLKIFLKLWKELDKKNIDYTLEEIKNAGTYVVKPKRFKYMNKELFKDTYGILEL